ncbi:MAG: cytochrome c biogenesis protein ResB [Alphaproteobacteria bacterium]|nr:cytochrome c biogenesis protein ResB [Alphaproteobacteria bacterium]
MRARIWPTLSWLGSLKATLVWLALTALVLAHSIANGEPVSVIIALPFAGLGLNLLLTLVVNRHLRSQSGLLLFHLGLALIAVLAALGRLLALSGHVEVTEGAAFEPALVVAEQGPLHPGHLDRVSFVQGSFRIHYDPGVKRRDTVSTVFLLDGADGWQPAEVGDDRPLVVGGYRFYTSFNKGFAPLLTYRDASGGVQQGAVHLPSFPLKSYEQGNHWTLPDQSAEVKLWLDIEDAVVDENTAWTFRTPDATELVVIAGDERTALQPGDSMALGRGRLSYDGLKTWMGYSIYYDPTRRWLLAAAAMAALGLFWHIVGKLRLARILRPAGRQGVYSHGS